MSRIAIDEGWGVPVVRNPDGTVTGRQQVDWGDSRKAFPDHLPLPEGLNEADWYQDD